MRCQRGRAPSRAERWCGEDITALPRPPAGAGRHGGGQHNGGVCGTVDGVARGGGAASNSLCPGALRERVWQGARAEIPFSLSQTAFLQVRPACKQSLSLPQHARTRSVDDCTPCAHACKTHARSTSGLARASTDSLHAPARCVPSALRRSSARPAAQPHPAPPPHARVWHACRMGPTLEGGQASDPSSSVSPRPLSNEHRAVFFLLPFPRPTLTLPMANMQGQDWNPVILSKRRPGAKETQTPAVCREERGKREGGKRSPPRRARRRFFFVLFLHPRPSPPRFPISRPSRPPSAPARWRRSRSMAEPTRHTARRARPRTRPSWTGRRRSCRTSGEVEREDGVERGGVGVCVGGGVPHCRRLLCV